MSLFGFLGNLFSLNSDQPTTNSDQPTTGTDINPANGLPMIDSSIDVKGNPWGTDLNNDHSSFSSHDDFFKNDHNDFGGGGFGGGDFGGGGFGGFD